MKHAHQKTFVSSLLLSTLFAIIPAISISGERKQASKQDRLVGAANVETKIAGDTLTISLPMTELHHMLTCLVDKDSWFARCTRCDNLRAATRAAIQNNKRRSGLTYMMYEVKS